MPKAWLKTARRNGQRPTDMEIRDGDWILIDHQPATGRTVWAFHHGDGRITTRTDYPVEQMINQNKAMLNSNLGKRWGDGQVAARIPKNLFYEKLAPAIEQDDDKYVSKFLNDSDNAAFRTFGGKV